MTITSNSENMNTLRRSINLARAMIYNEIIAERNHREKDLNNQLKQCYRVFNHKMEQLAEKISYLKPGHDKRIKLEEEKWQLQRQFAAQVKSLEHQIALQNKGTTKTRDLYYVANQLNECIDNLESEPHHSISRLKEICQTFTRTFPQSRPKSTLHSFFKIGDSPLQLINRELTQATKIADDFLKNSGSVEKSFLSRLI